MQTHLFKCLTVPTISSQEAETADSSAPVGSGVTVEETVTSERPPTSRGEPENPPPDGEDIQQKVEPGGQLATRENDKNQISDSWHFYSFVGEQFVTKVFVAF